MKARSQRLLVRDLLVVTLSIAASYFLLRSGLIHDLTKLTEDVRLLHIFIAGLLFTSVFTIPLAVVMLGHMSLMEPLWLVVSVGSVGALVGDLVLFLILRTHVQRDLEVLMNNHHFRRLYCIFQGKLFHWVIPFIGALIIASPLPDELGLALMGFSRVRLYVLVPISLAMNALGITLVALAAQALG